MYLSLNCTVALSSFENFPYKDSLQYNILAISIFPFKLTIFIITNQQTISTIFYHTHQHTLYQVPRFSDIQKRKTSGHNLRFSFQCGRWDLNPHDCNSHKILSLARLPVPTLPHVCQRLSYSTKQTHICQHLFLFFLIFLKNIFFY